MKILGKTIQIRLYWIFVFCMFVLCVVFGVLFFKNIGGDIVATLWGSLIASFFVATIQLCLSYYEYEKTSMLDQLGLIGIFSYRNDKKKYAKYIETAKSEIDILGHTAYRFFLDFANVDPSASLDDKLLLSKLQEGVVVRILLPNSQYLPKDKISHFNEVKKMLADIKKKLPDADISIRYFDHIANHSVFRVDESCILGPIFSKRESKYTPGIQLKQSSRLAKSYLDYFEGEWKDAHE